VERFLRWRFLEESLAPHRFKSASPATGLFSDPTVGAKAVAYVFRLTATMLVRKVNWAAAARL
jgi:hypothetical protein